MSYAILRTAKLKTFGNIAGSLHHTFRSIVTPNADPDLTNLNKNTYGNTEDALNAIRKKIPEKRRKDAVLCIEYLITASPQWSGWNTDKQEEYFRKSLEWLEQKHGKENVVMTSLQLDESTPHFVAYVVPIDEKGKLNAKKFLGGREKMRKMQSDFAEEIGKPLGLERGIEGSKAEHQTIKQYYAKVNKTLDKPTIAMDIPKRGLLESHESYEDKIFTLINEKVTPVLEHTYALDNHLTEMSRELVNTKKYLKDVMDDTKPYREAMLSLPKDYRPQLILSMQDTARYLADKSRKDKLERERLEEEQKRSNLLQNQQKSDIVPKPEIVPEIVPVSIQEQIETFTPTPPNRPKFR